MVFQHHTKIKLALYFDHSFLYLLLEYILTIFLILDHIHLEINTLGDQPSRERYREALVNYLSKHEKDLDEDCRRRLQSNPLRVLDSKNPQMGEILSKAPKLVDYLNETSRAHFDGVEQLLTELGIPYKINSRIVRGLDYYSHVVYEWVAESSLGAQNTVSAGGRYDGLVEQLGGPHTPATGFAMGLERVLHLLSQTARPFSARIDAYLVMVGEKAESVGRSLSENLRNSLPTLHLMTHCGGGNFKAQFKKADKSGAKFALILGEDELNTHSIGVKYLREEKPQLTLSIAELGPFLQRECLDL